MLITLFKYDSNERMRYFCVHDRQRDLFEPYTLTVISGTAIRGGKEKTYCFDHENAMEHHLRQLCTGRIRLGYKVLYAFSRQSHHRRWFAALPKHKPPEGLESVV